MYMFYVEYNDILDHMCCNHPGNLFKLVLNFKELL